MQSHFMRCAGDFDTATERCGSTIILHNGGVSHHLSCLTQISHLFIVAGYPTLGKSSSLWQSAQTGFALFGEDNGAVVPRLEVLGDVGEDSDTKAKLKAGFWLTLGDLPHLNNEPRLPKLLILHLDLLLVYLLLRDRGDAVSGTGEFAAAFARLLAQPALRSYEKYTVTTLYSPIEEVQRRWRHRYPDGVPSNCGKILMAKDKLINDKLVAAPLFAGIHRAWADCLASLSRSGVLASHQQLGSSLRSDMPTSG
jgi:hypothetical protein